MIDTWNVLHQTGILPPEDAGIGIRGLTNLIQKSRFQGCQMTLVCDGTNVSEAISAPHVMCIFTGPHKSADDEIVERVKESSGARDILVISSDLAIIKAVRAAGAQCMKSQHFLQLLVNDSRLPEAKRTQRPSGLSEQHANNWKTIFDIDDSLIGDMVDAELPCHLQRMNQDREYPLKPTENKSASTKPTKRDDDVVPPSLIDEARKLLDP
tara:strand:+ start:169 stop:801 length:633 start_codon:yes stop_codon:yes gene_type:complete